MFSVISDTLDLSICSIYVNSFSPFCLSVIYPGSPSRTCTHMRSQMVIIHPNSWGVYVSWLLLLLTNYRFFAPSRPDPPTQKKACLRFFGTPWTFLTSFLSFVVIFATQKRKPSQRKIIPLAVYIQIQYIETLTNSHTHNQGDTVSVGVYFKLWLYKWNYSEAISVCPSYSLYTTAAARTMYGRGSTELFLRAFAKSVRVCVCLSVYKIVCLGCSLSQSVTLSLLFPVIDNTRMHTPTCFTTLPLCLNQIL